MLFYEGLCTTPGGKQPRKGDGIAHRGKSQRLFPVGQKDLPLGSIVIRNRHATEITNGIPSQHLWCRDILALRVTAGPAQCSNR